MSNIFQYFESTFPASIHAYERFLREKMNDEHHMYTISKIKPFSSNLITLYAEDIYRSANTITEISDEQLAEAERRSRIYFAHAWRYFQYEWAHKGYGELFIPNTSIYTDESEILSNVLTSHIIKRFNPDQDTVDFKFYHYVHRDSIYEYFSLFINNMAAIFMKLAKSLGINSEYYLEFIISATMDEIMSPNNVAPQQIDIQNLVVYFNQVRTVSGDDTDMLGILPAPESNMGVYDSPISDEKVPEDVNHQLIPRSDTHLHIAPFRGRRAGMAGASQAISAAEMLVNNAGYALSHLTGDVNNPQDIEKNKAYAGVLIYGTLFLLLAMILRGKSD
jgi:hypothetical protein